MTGMLWFIAMMGMGGEFWYHNIDDSSLAIAGYDPVAYHLQSEAVKGRPEFAWHEDGVTYHFASKQHLERFQEDPQGYAPAYGGWCAFAIGVDKDKYGWGPVRFDCDPTSFKIVDGRLMLFANLPQFDARKIWESEDERELVKRADAFWASRVALGRKTPELPQGMNRRAPMETAQFDFLIGSWENKVKWMVDLENRQYGKEITGHWEARYSWDGYGVADDWNQVGIPGSGGPAFRSFDPSSGKWVMTYIPANQPRDRVWVMEGEFNDEGELIGEMDGVDGRGRAFKQRVNFYDITPNGFMWRADRSYDGGKTWIEAVGIAPARRLK